MGLLGVVDWVEGGFFLGLWGRIVRCVGICLGVDFGLGKGVCGYFWVCGMEWVFVCCVRREIFFRFVVLYFGVCVFFLDCYLLVD